MRSYWKKPIGPHDKAKYLKFLVFYKHFVKYKLTFLKIEFFNRIFFNKIYHKFVIKIKVNINAKYAYLPPGLKNQQTNEFPI